MSEFQLADFDRRAIDAAIAFANCEAKNGLQVRRLFNSLSSGESKLGHVRIRRLPIWRNTRAEEAELWRSRDQLELRKWLSQIVEGGNVLPSVRRELAERIREIPVRLPRLEFKDGQLVPIFTLDLDSPRACYSYAVALLVSRDAEPLAKMVGCCERCGLFFFGFMAGVGRRRKYCTDRCRNQHNSWKFANYDRKWSRPELP